MDVIASLLNRAIDNALKVESKWWEIYGLSPQGLYESITSRWWCQIILAVASIILGTIIEHYVL